MRQQPVLIQLHSESDVDFVVRALAAYSSAADVRVEGWDVHVDIRSRALGDVLSVLHACLVENDIPLVRIKIDDRTYMMEPAPEGSPVEQR